MTEEHKYIGSVLQNVNKNSYRVDLLLTIERTRDPKLYRILYEDGHDLEVLHKDILDRENRGCYKVLGTSDKLKAFFYLRLENNAQ